MQHLSPRTSSHWRMGYPMYFQCLLCLLISCMFFQNSRADWIKPLVSPRAGTDSIQRVLVIRDTDSLESFGKQMLDLGDIEGGPGHELLITRWQGGYDSNRCFIFDGGQFADGVVDRSYLYFGYKLDQIGDVNVDGYVDFGQYHLPLKSPEDFDIFLGGPQFDNIADLLIPNHNSFAYEAVDVDGDGTAELPVIRNINSYSDTIDFFKVGTNFDTIPEYMIVDTSRTFGYTLCTGDFNGDGLGDVAVSSHINIGDTGRVYVYFGGNPYDPNIDLVINDTTSYFGRILFNVGDLNNDGFDDLLICNGNSPGGIYLGSTPFDGTRDIIVNQYRGDFGYFPPTSVDRAGDVNDDGYPDFIIGYVVSGARYEAHLYLGGADLTPLMPADLWIEDFMIPGPQYSFGASVAGIGDFTGDGIDDFAVRSTTAPGNDTWYGEVNVFAGWRSTSTDVPNDEILEIPSEVSLHQNYPNPFNSGTWIEFELEKSSAVSLTIFNLAGNITRYLVDKQLPTGSYRIYWDGKDYAGVPVASGTYLYRLQVGKQKLSKKMQLIK